MSGLLHLIRENAVIIGVVIFWLLAIIVLAVWPAFSVEGWHDQDGWHAGREPDANRGSASARDDRLNHNRCNAADGSRNHG